MSPKFIARVLFLTACAVLLGYGMSMERHRMRKLDDPQMQILSGPQFVQGATVDSYMLKDGGLYDAYSLSKATANEKDCKT